MDETDYSIQGNQPEREFETQAWTGRGINPKEGALSLAGGRLRFELEGAVLFDAPVPELNLTWPWYGFGCQFWAHAQGQKWFISALHTNNSIGSWMRGVQRGRRWKRALEAALQG